MNRKILLSSLIGSAIEWFDYFLYGTLAALIFSKQFFPSHDPMAGTLLAYLTFSLTFIVRPFGGIVFAHIGDRLGRKTALVATLSMMGVGTAMIGLLPTYDSIGVAAPILLVLLRIVQGIGIGGEWGGALLLAYENAPESRKGLFGSIPQVGVTIGMLLSTLCVSLVSLLPDEAFQSWGWRLPFALAGVTVVVGLWLRRAIGETPEFAASREEQKEEVLPVVQTVRDHWREVLIAICAKSVETAPFYIFTVLLISYATGILGMSRLVALNAVTIGAVVASLMIPLAGALSDRIGRRATYVTGCIALALFAWPYFQMLDRRTALSLIVATIIGFGLIWPLVTAVLGTLMSDLFPAEVRFTGITLGYQIGAALVGGTAPMIATWILASDGGNWRFIALYIVLSAVISLAAVLRCSLPAIGNGHGSAVRHPVTNEN